MTEIDGSKEAEQIQIARAIGAELTDTFVAYVRAASPSTSSPSGSTTR